MAADLNSQEKAATLPLTLEPSPWIFMLAFLPQFVDPSRGSVAAQLFIFGATQKFTGFVILCVYAVASGAMKSPAGKLPAAGDLVGSRNANLRAS